MLRLNLIPGGRGSGGIWNRVCIVGFTGAVGEPPEVGWVEFKFVELSLEA